MAANLERAHPVSEAIVSHFAGLPLQHLPLRALCDFFESASSDWPLRRR